MQQTTFKASLPAAAQAAATCTLGLSDTEVKTGNIVSIMVHDNLKLPPVGM